jgi:hypothetical protein
MGAGALCRAIARMKSQIRAAWPATSPSALLASRMDVKALATMMRLNEARLMRSAALPADVPAAMKPAWKTAKPMMA